MVSPDIDWQRFSIYNVTTPTKAIQENSLQIDQWYLSDENDKKVTNLLFLYGSVLRSQVCLAYEHRRISGFCFTPPKKWYFSAERNEGRKQRL